jgi:hypothetical protein
MPLEILAEMETVLLEEVVLDLGWLQALMNGLTLPLEPIVWPSSLSA